MAVRCYNGECLRVFPLRILCLLRLPVSVQRVPEYRAAPRSVRPPRAEELLKNDEMSPFRDEVLFVRTGQPEKMRRENEKII